MPQLLLRVAIPAKQNEFAVVAPWRKHCNSVRLSVERQNRTSWSQVELRANYLPEGRFELPSDRA